MCGFPQLTLACTFVPLILGIIAVALHVRNNLTLVPGEARQGKARQGEARQGKARQGKARQGKARQGKARQGKERQGKERQGKARQGKARQGKARRGKARRPKSKLKAIVNPCTRQLAFTFVKKIIVVGSCMEVMADNDTFRYLGGLARESFLAYMCDWVCTTWEETSQNWSI